MPDYDESYPKEGKPQEAKGISKAMAPVSSEGLGRIGELATGAAKIYKQLGSDYVSQVQGKKLKGGEYNYDENK